MKLKFTKNGLVKEVKVGISFTTMFLGFFVAILRRQWIVLLITWMTFGLSNFYFMFVMNKMYAQNLINDGWKVVEEDQSKAYTYFGIIPTKFIG